jgi:hypothetical protein
VQFTALHGPETVLLGHVEVAIPSINAETLGRHSHAKALQTTDMLNMYSTLMLVLLPKAFRIWLFLAVADRLAQDPCRVT